MFGSVKSRNLVKLGLAILSIEKQQQKQQQVDFGGVGGNRKNIISSSATHAIHNLRKMTNLNGHNLLLTFIFDGWWKGVHFLSTIDGK